MTRSTNRAAAWLTGTALAAGLLLAGCSAGQIAETARKAPSVQGVNADAQLRDDDGRIVGSVAVRDVMVAYDGPEGYERGGAAPLEVRIFNDTPEAVTVRVASAGAQEESDQIIQAGSVVLRGGSDQSESPSPTGAPATVEIPAGGFVVLTEESGRYLSLTGLRDRLLPGMSVPLSFQFSNGLELSVNAPVATPLAPAQRATPDIEEPAGGH